MLDTENPDQNPDQGATPDRPDATVHAAASESAASQPARSAPASSEPTASRPARTPRKRAAKKVAATSPVAGDDASTSAEQPLAQPTVPGEPTVATVAKRAPRKAAARKSGATQTAAPEPGSADSDIAAGSAVDTSPAPAKRVTRTRRRATTEPETLGAPLAEQPAATAPVSEASPAAPESPTATKATRTRARRVVASPALSAASVATPEAVPAADTAPPPVLFQAPSEAPAAAAPTSRRRRKATAPAGTDTPITTEVLDGAAEAIPSAAAHTVTPDAAAPDTTEDGTTQADTARAEAPVATDDDDESPRRRRRRGRRGRGNRAENGDTAESDSPESDSSESDSSESDTASTEPASDDASFGDDREAAADAEESPSSRRRRRRRRSGSGGDDSASDDAPTPAVTRVRERRSSADSGDEVKGVRGSARLEAKRQRRRDGRDSGRRRGPILSEAEFLARREAVDRVMAVRQRGERTQIAILEDDILVEHYVTRASSTSYVGNVYLGRVQNVLPSMEAAFVDLGKSRNGVLYAGEVNWDAAGLEGKARAIEAAMRSGDALLVQVTKDPIGHKGARLTSQISLPGRFLVLVPGGGMTGISRKLPDTERQRLKAILKKIVPEDAGVIVRTAAEGASEEDLTRDVERLTAQWKQIQATSAKPSDAPTLVHGEPDLAIRVVRDVFNEDFASMVVEGDGAWAQVSQYVEGVAPDLADRVHKYTGASDLFHDLRVDEQLAKALDRKVWLPSGGSLVIDRTEAMVVIDVNTGKFTGSGGNLEQTVTRNNLEAAEEIVRQMRLRDIGGIVVIDFIDMVLESNRELVLRRLTECLGRDRTKHQVAEVTSLGLVQMTRKRVGEGLLEAFSEPCEVCHGRGVIVHTEPVDQQRGGGGGDEERPASATSKKLKRTKAQRAEDERSAAEAAEQRRLAATAMNAIAQKAAGSGHDSDSDSADTTAEADLVPDAAEPDDALPADVDPDDTDPVSALPSEMSAEAPPADETFAAPTPPEAVPQEPAAVSVPSAATPVVEPGAIPANGTRPRRRRAASRPAGPPQPVNA